MDTILLYTLCFALVISTYIFVRDFSSPNKAVRSSVKTWEWHMIDNMLL